MLRLSILSLNLAMSVSCASAIDGGMVEAKLDSGSSPDAFSAPPGPDASMADAAPEATPDAAPPEPAALVPTMTSDTSPQGIVTYSGTFSEDYPGFQAFDGTNSLWLSNQNVDSVWLAYEWGAAVSKTVASYDITFTNGSLDERGPRDWQLQGWNGSDWVVLDSETGHDDWAITSSRSFDADVLGAFVQHRLLFLNDNFEPPTYPDPIHLISVGRVQFHGY